MRFNELHTQSGHCTGTALLVGFSDAVGQGGDAALFEVLIHEGIHDRIVEAVEEPNGLNNGDEHGKCHPVVFLLQVIWTVTHRDKVIVSLRNEATICLGIVLISNYPFKFTLTL